YSEAMTDPSYFGQILTFTYPLIGNYGIPDIPKELTVPIPRGFESERVNTAAVIVSIDSAEAFHWNSFSSLDQWLKQQNVPGIVGLDTRHLVHLVRGTPNLPGQVIPEAPEGHRDFGDGLTEAAKDSFVDPGSYEILSQVSTPERRILAPMSGKAKARIGLVDCGVKWNIIRQLLELGCEVELVPWNARLDDV